MTDQLSAKDWLDLGLKVLAEQGFTALKAEPLAKAMGVSRGSFYWHFADIGAFHAAILKHWREVAAEQIIADLEAATGDDNPLQLLLRQAFGGRLALENAVRSWATHDPRRAPRGAGDRPAPGDLCGKHAQGRRACAESGARPGANPLLGVCRLCAVRQALAAGGSTGRARRTAADRLAIKCRHSYHRLCYGVSSEAGLGLDPGRLPVRAKKRVKKIQSQYQPEKKMSSPPERLEGTVDPKLLEILVCPLTKGPLEYRRRAAGTDLAFRETRLSDPRRHSDHAAGRGAEDRVAHARRDDRSCACDDRLVGNGRERIRRGMPKSASAPSMRCCRCRRMSRSRRSRC